MADILHDPLVAQIVKNTYALLDDCQMNWKTVLSITTSEEIAGAKWSGTSDTTGKITIT
jgi:hypothetical protein